MPDILFVRQNLKAHQGVHIIIGNFDRQLNFEDDQYS